MGWPLRMFQEEGYYFVTSRCIQGRLLLRPSAEVNEVVGGVLAKAVQQSAGTVRLHGFTFASNHFHLLVWARGAALAFFMQYLRANLSRKVGRLVDWRGGFWERRYSAEPVLDDEALVGRLRYVLTHGVKEGLVDRSAEWPGLTCLPQLLGPARRVFQWFNWTKRWSKRGSEEGRGASCRSGPSRWNWRWHRYHAGKDWVRRRGCARCEDSWSRWKPRLARGAGLSWGRGRYGHSTRIPGPSTSSAARGRWGMPPLARP